MALPIPAEAPVTIMTSLASGIFNIKKIKDTQKAKIKAVCFFFIFFALIISLR
jgi:hypothetical protein